MLIYAHKFSTLSTLFVQFWHVAYFVRANLQVAKNSSNFLWTMSNFVTFQIWVLKFGNVLNLFRVQIKNSVQFDYF